MKNVPQHVIVSEAIDALAGPAIVLDEELRVAFVSEAAERVLGLRVPIGASAPALLCGSRPKRPVAEALAGGRPVQALVPRPGDDEVLVHVRSVPLRRGRTRVGWLLLLSEASDLHAEPELFHGMWTADPRMKRLFRTLQKVAQDDVPVLVRGETGTGKELVAAALHAESARARGPYRAINCAALPPTLLESELFGHVRGAFTGAVKDTPGHIALAHKGTLFLDEVAEIPLELQAKLLRVLESHEVVPVGGRSAHKVDVRVIAATHRSLRAEVDAGRFRGDLMYRLRVIPLFIPPLRDRRGDIELLVSRLLVELNPVKRRQVERLSPAAMLALERHAWPGNVRELRNVMAYAYAIGDGPIIELGDLPPELTDRELGPLTELAALERASDARPPLATAPGAAPSEAERIAVALERAGGHRAEAAKELGVSRVTLWRRMRELGLARGR